MFKVGRRAQLYLVYQCGNGTVSVTAPLTGSGQHTIVAIYSGDLNYFHNNSNPVAVTVQ
jgi:hypothetical protein